MPPVQTVTTAAGEEMVLISREDYEDLIDASDHAAAMRDIAAGRMGTLTDAELGQYLAAPTPLAFWRQRRGLSEAAAAAAVGVSEAEYAAIESGAAQAELSSYARLARVMKVRIDDLVDAHA